MATSVGRRVLSSSGRTVSVLADGTGQYKNVTLDTDLFTAVSGAAVTLPDENVIPIGTKYARFGQVVTIVGKAEIQTITESGSPTGGTFVIVFPEDDEGHPEEETAALAFDATAAAVQTAINNLNRFSENKVVVTRSGTTTNFVWTLTYHRLLGDQPPVTITDSTTGGTHAFAVATSQAGVGEGMYGPYDPDATDGRQTLSRGDCAIIPYTWNFDDESVPEHPPAIEGGLLFKDRVLMTTGTHTLAAGPTVAEVEAAFPTIRWFNL